VRGGGGGGHLTGTQRDNLVRASLFKVRASFAFQKRRPGRAATPGTPSDQPACHLMSAGAGALMKLIEQRVIDNGTARQRPPPHHRSHQPFAAHAASISRIVFLPFPDGTMRKCKIIRECCGALR